jgi:hypothetical protein
MDFNSYQACSRATARYPDAGRNPTYPTLGLCGEAGEVADKVKKVLRDHGGVFDEAGWSWAMSSGTSPSWPPSSASPWRTLRRPTSTSWPAAPLVT